MPSVGQMIQFKAGLYANFAAITSKDVNTIYFCTDTQQIFVGDTEYSRPVLSGTGAPSDGAAKHNPPRTLYFDTTNKNLYVTLDDGKWVKITDSSIASNLTTLQYELMKLLASVTNQSAGGGSTESFKSGGTVTPTSVRAAATIVTMAPIVCLYPFLQRYFVTGLTIGGVKE